ncbi:MAG: alkaline phosphatase PhoX [Planctomycetota bacterium]
MKVHFSFWTAVGIIVGVGGPAHGQVKVPDVLGWTPLAYKETEGDQFAGGIAAKVLITSGDAMTESPGYKFRKKPDFNVYFATEDGGVLFTNHEIVDTDPSSNKPEVGKENLSGGVSRLRLSLQNDVLSSSMHEWQTSYNCSGGLTPWETFLSCEENPKPENNKDVDDTGWYKDDGFVWEIDPKKPQGRVRVDAIGRFSHEAADFDLDGNVYLTDDFVPSILFKFVPAEKGTVQKGGTLFALDATKREWIKIDDVGRARSEAVRKGATQFQRGEGIARHPKNPDWMHFAVTGSATSYEHAWGRYLHGAVLALNIKTLEIKEVVVSSQQDDQPGAEPQLQGPDNIRFDENGVLYICEDHGNESFGRDAGGKPKNQGRNEILALWEGKLYRFAIVGSGKAEWTGPFFAKTGAGKTMFVTNQGPGKVYALTGFGRPTSSESKTP